MAHAAGPYGALTEGDRIQRAWAELTNLMRETNVGMFESKRRTEDAVADGSYMKFLEKYTPRLRTFRERFESTGGTAIPWYCLPTALTSLVSGVSATMIRIEYEYARK